MLRKLLLISLLVLGIFNQKIHIEAEEEYYFGLLATIYDNQTKQWIDDSTELFHPDSIQKEQFKSINLAHKQKILANNFKNDKIYMTAVGDGLKIPDLTLEQNLNNGDIQNIFSDEATRNFFNRARVRLAQRANYQPDDLRTKRIDLFFEPCLIYKLKGQYYAFTVTSYLLYKQQNPNSDLFAEFENNNKIYTNLLLNHYLERDFDNGIKYYNKNTISKDSLNEVAFQSGGIFYVNYIDEQLDNLITTHPKYQFIQNQTAIISVELFANKESNPDQAFMYHFEIDGYRYPDKKIFYPQNSTVYLHQKFTVPSKLGSLDVKYCTNQGCDILDVEVVDEIVEYPPPNPRSDKLYPINLKTYQEKNEEDWWYEYVVEGDKDSQGKYHFKQVKKTCPSYDGKIKFDMLNPSLKNNRIKSGYGFNIIIDNLIDNDYCINAQNLEARFPEFNYQKYNRILEHKNNFYQFKANKFHPNKLPVHYTPLNFPNGEYQLLIKNHGYYSAKGKHVSERIFKFNIQDNLWDDYHIHNH